MGQKEQIHPWSMILLRSYTVKCRLLLNFLSVPSILPVHSTLWFLPAFWHEQTASRSEILNTNLYTFLPSQSNSFPVTLTCCGAQKHITWVIVPLNFSGRMNLRITVRPASDWNHRWLERLLFHVPPVKLGRENRPEGKSTIRASLFELPLPARLALWQP